MEMPENEVQPEGQATVTIDENGMPQGDSAAFLDAVGFKDDDPEPKPKEEIKPPEDKPTEKPPVTTPEPTAKRKIKWQGQDVEIEPDKETEFIQKGFDYTQKMQKLSDERDLLTPHIGVIKAIQSDPTLQQKIAEHLTGRPAEKAEAKQTFDDPIQQLEHDIEQRLLAKVEQKYIQPMQQSQTQMTHLQRVNAMKAQVQADPMFADVQKAIHDSVDNVARTMGEDVARTMVLQLDQDIPTYLKTYNTMRQTIAAKKPPTDSPPDKKPLPEPTKREEHAPILESANTAPTESEEKAHSENLKALNKRARTGDMHALGELLLKGGMMKGIID
jgi:hypothetical protein